MRRLAAILALAALSACASPRPMPDHFHGLKPIAQPGDLIAAELAFARTAQEEGQWTAFAEFAAEDGVMFTPQMVNAKEWLKGRDNPPQALTWQPVEVWSSCDGSLGVNKGAWQRPDGAVGWFTTVWQRHEDGSYRWLLDHGDRLDSPLPAPEMIASHVARCNAPPPSDEMTPVLDLANGKAQGVSRDRTLVWRVHVTAAGARRVMVLLWNGESYDPVIDESVVE